MKTLNESLQSQQSAKPDCHVWDVNLEAVLYELFERRAKRLGLRLPQRAASAAFALALEKLVERRFASPVPAFPPSLPSA